MVALLVVMVVVVVRGEGRGVSMGEGSSSEEVRNWWELGETPGKDDWAVSSAIEEIAGVSSVLEGRIVVEEVSGVSEVEGVVATGETRVVVAAGVMSSAVSGDSVVRFSKEKKFVSAMELTLALLLILMSESPKVR